MADDEESVDIPEPDRALTPPPPDTSRFDPGADEPPTQREPGLGEDPAYDPGGLGRQPEEGDDDEDRR